MKNYIDESDEFLRFFVEEIAPTVELMADVAVDSIKSKILRQDEPSDPGEGPASHGPEFLLYESWRRGRVRRVGDEVRCAVYSTARSEDGEVSLALVMEYGSDTIQPRSHIRPGMDAARSRMLALAKGALE